MVDQQIRTPSRKGLAALLIGFIGFILWAFLVSMDRGVIVPGTLTFQGERKSIVHPHGGVVKKIWVGEGQIVQQGQILISLDATDSRAQMNALEVQRQALLAKMARLQMESGTNKTQQLESNHAHVASEVKKSEFQSQQQATEITLYQTRQRALQNDIHALQTEISITNNSLAALKEAQQIKQRQLETLKQQEISLTDMVNKGFMPANRLLDIQSQISTLQVALAQDQMQYGQLSGQTSNARLKQQQLRNQQQAESQALLAEVQTELANLEEQTHRVAFVLKHTEIQSPVAGQVIGLQLFTPGSAMPANTPLMDIAPSHTQLEISAQLAPDLVDQVKLGQTVTVRFSALKTAQTLEVQGELNSVGADQLVDAIKGISYIPLKIRFTPQAASQIAEHRIQSGVPVELLVVTGEQTLMQYLFKPITDRLFTAMREH